jgi:TctA family transporter
MLFWIFFGVIIGLIVGILPGLGGTATLAILLPIVYGLDPSVALIFLIAVHVVVYQGGLITSVLFGIPGEETSTATLLDGYPMAQKGKAGRALANGQMASMLGGVFGGVFLAVLIPVARPIILAFGAPELFMVSVIGLSFVAVLSRGSTLKAIVAGALGFFASNIGYQDASGTLRFTGGFFYFWEGLKIVPVFMGLFALPEVVDLAVEGGTIAKGDKSEVKWSDVIQGIKDVLTNWWLMIRCSAIGTAIGIIPGVGGVVAQFLCYGHAKQTSKRSEEFGLGCEEGVIAPESGNNSKVGGALLTTLVFGIPGSAAMVIILSAMMILGIEPGPGMLTDHLDLLWMIVITVIVANCIASLVGLVSARSLAQLTFVKASILVPIIMLMVILGAYGVASDIKDVLTAFAFGFIGYLMKIYDFSSVTFTIGYVLGDYAERYFLIALASLGPGFLLRSPIALILLSIAVLVLLGGPIGKVIRKRRNPG